MLDRFLAAQAEVYKDVLAELGAGQKRSHWMWFVFPQLRGLGRSAMAERYGIAGLTEAQSYLEHPVLGPRLRECVELVLQHREKSVHAIFGAPDDMKFRSSMTLFSRAAPGEDGAIFCEALVAFHGGDEDTRTVELLGGAAD